MIDKIKNLIDGIQYWIESEIKHDKLLHFTITLLLTLPCIIEFKFIIVPIIICILKEVIDKYIRKTGFDKKDVLFGFFGMIPVLIILLIKYIKYNV